MDIEMPGMNGIDAVKLLKENFPYVKVLMETIFEDNDKIFQSICNGAEGYILKNTSPVFNLMDDTNDGCPPQELSLILIPSDHGPNGDLAVR